jgi:predicted dehydrogenase
MKFGIIGAGRMGRRHIAAATKLGYKLVGVVDQSQNSLTQTQQEFNLKNDALFGTLESLFKNVIPDLLIIATTADSHCSYVCRAASLGVRYILVEKPLATSLEQCNQMIRTCKDNGALLSVNHQMRFMDQYLIPKSLLSSELYGGFKSMTVVGGNFGMSMNGAHYVEAFRFMSDEEPYEVSAWFDSLVVPNPRGKNFEDRAGSLRVTTASGRRLYIEIGADQGHGLEVIYGGRNGIIKINELTGEMVTNVRKNEFINLPTTRYGMPSEIQVKHIKPVELVDSTGMVLNALTCNINRVTAEQGMKAVEVLAAAYESAENGSRSVRLDGYLNRTRIFPWG